MLTDLYHGHLLQCIPSLVTCFRTKGNFSPPFSSSPLRKKRKREKKLVTTFSGGG